jgi:hypothetical protein
MGIPESPFRYAEPLPTLEILFPIVPRPNSIEVEEGKVNKQAHKKEEKTGADDVK